MTYGELVAADLDVLYIATPHPQHRDLALAAIRNGTPVLVEKSFTATLDGAREVVAAARGAGVFCMEAMWTRMQPAVLAARELVATGEIGEVRRARGLRCPPDLRPHPPTVRAGARRRRRPRPRGLRHLHRPALPRHPERVTAAGALYPNGTDASVSLLLSYDDGRGASLSTTLQARPDAGPRWSAPAARSRSRRRSTTRRDSCCGARGSRRRSAPHLLSAAATPTRSSTSASAWLPVSPRARSCRSQDTLDVQWVLQETLDQLGVVTAEGVVDLTG